MRRHQQQQILDILETIGEAQEAKLYADCEYGARSVAGFIDENEREGTRTAALLNEYCEMLGDLKKGRLSDQELRQQLSRIEQSVKEELRPNKIEIAFLSYKASMSDSIETIYLAAKNDPEVDAYWIPIPYFERNADGSLGRMIYEGSEHYGKDIECTDWRKYDIAARRPDVIITFAPYDGANRVTSVHPDFYCEYLRNLTDMLVYVPYFVSADDVKEHFCVVPGCMYAHKVMVQSERIRSIYMNAFTKRYGNAFGDPREKFVVLGSPKVDKGVLAAREDYPLPPEWEKVIAGRKVVFYNLTIGKVLTFGERYLEKLRASLDIFRNSTDVALWWRPHPLNDAGYRSIRPYLLAEYRRIIADFQREGWGIYDETSDLHRSLVWSDAYYGDMSSIVAIFYATGKPVLIDTWAQESAGREKGSKHAPADGGKPHAMLSSDELDRLEAAIEKSGQLCFDADRLPLPAFIHAFVNESPALGRLSQRAKETFLSMNANTDGTSGAKILDYCKLYVIEKSWQRSTESMVQ